KPEAFEASLLPLARISALWIWLAALALVAYWSRVLYGPRAMALAAWWFALSPNLLAHGALITMEIPILAAVTATALLFWFFLQNGDRRAFLGSAVLAGLAFSCKFTAVLAPPCFGFVWLIARWRAGERRLARLLLRVSAGMAGFVVIMALADVAITGCA